MSAIIKLSSALPGDAEVNGLDSLHDDIVGNPRQVICALVWLDVPKLTLNTEDGTEVPTVRVRKIEPVGTAEKVEPAVIELYNRTQEARLGREPLPFDQLDGRAEHVYTSEDTGAEDDEWDGRDDA